MSWKRSRLKSAINEKLCCFGSSNSWNQSFDDSVENWRSAKWKYSKNEPKPTKTNKTEKYASVVNDVVSFILCEKCFAIIRPKTIFPNRHNDSGFIFQPFDGRTRTINILLETHSVNTKILYNVQCSFSQFHQSSNKKSTLKDMVKHRHIQGTRLTTSHHHQIL